MRRLLPGWPTLLLLGMAVALVWALLAGCVGGPKSEPGNAGGYNPGMTYDAEDYRGPTQKVTGWAHEEAVTGTRVVRKADGTERYCVTRKNGVCKSWGTRTKYKSVTESYVSDDADWYLVLGDTTRVDVDEATQARYPVGAMYP